VSARVSEADRSEIQTPKQRNLASDPTYRQTTLSNDQADRGMAPLARKERKKETEATASARRSKTYSFWRGEELANAAQG